jgi:hypothetical protein
MRNLFPLDAVLDRAYKENVQLNPQRPTECAQAAGPRPAAACRRPRGLVRAGVSPFGRRDLVRAHRVDRRTQTGSVACYPFRSLRHRMVASRTLTIEPVTRIEGHARITIQLDSAGQVEDAKFHLTQYRGFEKFCEGRPYREMPALTARSCGICPVSHLVASSKACDQLLSVSIPPTAVKLRRMMNLAQFCSPTRCPFSTCPRPDFLLGWDSDPGPPQRVRLDEAASAAGQRRDPAPADRPDDHRDPRRQADPSGLDGARRRERSVDRRKAIRDAQDDPRRDDHRAADLCLFQRS